MLWYEEWFSSSINQCIYILDMKHLPCEIFKSQEELYRCTLWKMEIRIILFICILPSPYMCLILSSPLSLIQEA